MSSIFDFTVTPFYTLGITVWRVMLALIGVTAQQTPESFSQGTWNYVVNDIYPLFAAIGATLLNVFFYIGFIRQTSNLKQGMTLEIFVECCIKVLFGNALLQSAIHLMKAFFSLSGNIAGSIIFGTEIPFEQQDMDGGAVFFYMVFGIVFFAVCLVCSVTIFLVVYGRYLQLYRLVLAAPVALSTIPGGPGVSQTASSWFRTFLSQTFSIVFIALSLTIASKMCNGIDFGTGAEVIDGCNQVLQNIFTMILLTASVKGTDVFMRRTFGL